MDLAFPRLSATSSMSLPEGELIRLSVQPQQTARTGKTYKVALQMGMEALAFLTPYSNFPGNKGL